MKKDDKIVVLIDTPDKHLIMDEAIRDHMDTSSWCRGILLRHRDKLVDEREAREARMEMIRKGGVNGG